MVDNIGRGEVKLLIFEEDFEEGINDLVSELVGTHFVGEYP